MAKKKTYNRSRVSEYDQQLSYAVLRIENVIDNMRRDIQVLDQRTQAQVQNLQNQILKVKSDLVSDQMDS